MLSKFGKLLLSALLLFVYENNIAQSVVCDSILQVSRVETKKKNYLGSLEILSKAKALAERDSLYQDMFCALNEMAQTYYIMYNYGESLQVCLEAYDLALKKLDQEQQAIMLNNIAVLYSKQKDYEKAELYFKKALNIAENKQDSKGLGYYNLNLGDIANRMRRPKVALKYLKQALPYIENDPQRMLSYKVSAIRSEMLLGNFAQSRKNALNLYLEAKKINYNNQDIELLQIIAQSYLEDGNYDKALDYTYRVISANLDPEKIKESYGFLSDLYVRKGDYKNALRYKDSVMVKEQQLNDLKNGKQFEINKVKFEIANYKNEITLRDERLVAERKVFYSLLGISLSIVVIVVLMFRQRKIAADRNRKTAELALLNRQNENLILEKQIREKEAEQDRLKNEIETRNRELMAKALHVSTRNELIEEIVTTIAESPRLSKVAELSRYTKELKGHLKADNAWDNFLVHFEEVNPGFVFRLKAKHPTLTSNDVRFIIYLYMNLSLKEIAATFNITHDSCRKRKERISAKLDLPAGVNLYNYISNI